MSIYYHENTKTFHLTNGAVSYLMKVLPNGALGQLYFGQAIRDREDFDHLLEMRCRPMSSCVFEGCGSFSLEHCKQEYPSCGSTDFRHPAVELRQPNGSRITDFVYRSHTVTSGKPPLEGLPATYCEADGEAETLTVHLEDELLQTSLYLSYTLFAGQPVLARSARLENHGGLELHLTAAMSLSLDLPDSGYEFVHFSGAWSRERWMKVRRLEQGIQSVESARGNSSHNHNPFVMLRRPGTDEDQGEVIGLSLIYSGNFLAQAEMTQQEYLRAVIGIHPEGFGWKLDPGGSFQTPEAVLVYSGHGLEGMTHTFHDLYRNHLIREPWRNRPRPSLVNNWEATYFDFDTEKLLDIARTAAGRGIEMLVLDDGWFGCRDTDDNSLGDWFVNEKKLPGGLKYLADQINALGMKFGLWVEPEMVSPNSDLYRAHPDYALQIPGRKPMEARHQLVLDISRPEVRDCVYAQLKAALSSANIEYVKWDMNRSLTDVASFCLEADRQGELFHRYVLGVYELQERLLADFPGLLLENCCSGGGRFDPGMLYYSPQIWTSDNTDAVDRLRIQEGTALIYPLSSMGAHVAACPSHTNGRVTPFATRGLVSLPGCFGYELDLTKLTEEELDMIPGQLENYRKYGPVFHGGDYYRLASYGENGEYDALMSVSKDKRTAVLDYVHVMSRQRRRSVLLPLRGLDEETLYRSSETGEVRSGAGWMYGGMVMPCMTGDSTGKLIVLEAV